MITAQDIREKTFERKKVGGYDMDAVDDFLEELADDITASHKEVAMLKSKMQVLVDKINEYRANEETLNMAILSAQKLAEAKAATEKFFDGMRAMCSAQLKNLDNIAQATLPREAPEAPKAPKAVPAAPAPVEEEAEEDEEAVEDTVRTIEESVSKIKPEPSVKFDLSSAMKASSKPKKDFDSTQPFTL